MTNERQRRITELPMHQIAEEMSKFLRMYPTAKCFLKWWCPRCGERCTASEPNKVYPAMQHLERDNGEPCGGWYFGQMYGFSAIVETTNGKPPIPFYRGE